MVAAEVEYLKEKGAQESAEINYSKEIRKTRLHGDSGMKKTKKPCSLPQTTSYKSGNIFCTNLKPTIFNLVFFPFLPIFDL